MAVFTVAEFTDISGSGLRTESITILVALCAFIIGGFSPVRKELTFIADGM